METFLKTARIAAATGPSHVGVTAPSRATLARTVPSSTTRRFRRSTSERRKRLRCNLRGLSREVLQERLGTWLTKCGDRSRARPEGSLVRALEAQIASRGEAVFYELPRVGEPCGTGYSSAGAQDTLPGRVRGPQLSLYCGCVSMNVSSVRRAFAARSRGIRPARNPPTPPIAIDAHWRLSQLSCCSTIAPSLKRKRD